MEVQKGGEEEPWVSLTQAESLSQGEVVRWEKGAAEEEPWRAAHGQVLESRVCDTAGSQQGGMEEQAVGRPQSAGMSGRTWAANAAPLASAVGERISEAHPSCSQ